MKRIFAFLLCFFVLTEFSLTISAESESAPTFDLLSLPEFFKEYKKDRDNVGEYLEKFAESGFNKPGGDFYDAMPVIAEMNFILLPDFVDIKKARPDEIFVTIGNGTGYEVRGTADGTDYTLSFKGEKYDNLSEVLEQTENKNNQKMLDETVFIIGWSETVDDEKAFYKHDFVIAANNNIYNLTLETKTPFEEIWNSIDFQIFPLTNGFLHFGQRIKRFGSIKMNVDNPQLYYPVADDRLCDNLYYMYNGNLLVGWYRINGNLYHFEEDGVASKAYYDEGKTGYSFDENGVYLSTATSD
jgi:hypothetical protein